MCPNIGNFFPTPHETISELSVVNGAGLFKRSVFLTLHPVSFSGETVPLDMPNNQKWI